MHAAAGGLVPHELLGVETPPWAIVRSIVVDFTKAAVVDFYHTVITMMIHSRVHKAPTIHTVRSAKPPVPAQPLRMLQHYVDGPQPCSPRQQLRTSAQTSSSSSPKSKTESCRASAPVCVPAACASTAAARAALPAAAVSAFATSTPLRCGRRRGEEGEYRDPIRMIHIQWLRL